MQDPNKLEVYVEAKALAKECLCFLKSINNEFRLYNQLFGSVTSVPANLAEFAAMDAKGSKVEKLSRCIMESNETDYWLEVCRDQGHLDERLYKKLTERNCSIRKRICGLREKIKRGT